MKKCFCLILFILVSFAALGCGDDEANVMSSPVGCGMVSNAQTRNMRVAAISNLQTRMLLDDWDEVWFYDTNLKLTRWAVSVGN